MNSRSFSLFLLPASLLLIPVRVAWAENTSTPASTIAQTQPSEMLAPPWARNLNLSVDQRSQLKTVNDNARKQAEQLHQQLMAADQKLRSLLQSNASIDQLRQQHREVQKLRQALDDNRFEALLAERQVLTSDQLVMLIKDIRDRP